MALITDNVLAVGLKNVSISRCEPCCESLQYAVTPASGKNLWTGNASLNTWNGPILQGPDGVFHL